MAKREAGAYLAAMLNSFDDDASYHAHIYYSADHRPAAEALRHDFERLASETDPRILFVGRMKEGKAGPHPISQYEIHFLKRPLSDVLPMIEASGLRALVHPLTDDDLADHTTLAHWIGAPVDLDLTTLDPPGMNQGVPRFGKAD
jgi:DOPA 4,5-dioxygenase